jgi:hypothetical protein
MSRPSRTSRFPPRSAQRSPNSGTIHSSGVSRMAPLACCSSRARVVLPTPGKPTVRYRVGHGLTGRRLPAALSSPPSTLLPIGRRGRGGCTGQRRDEDAAALPRRSLWLPTTSWTTTGRRARCGVRRETCRGGFVCVGGCCRSRRCAGRTRLGQRVGCRSPRPVFALSAGDEDAGRPLGERTTTHRVRRPSVVRDGQSPASSTPNAWVKKAIASS